MNRYTYILQRLNITISVYTVLCTNIGLCLVSRRPVLCLHDPCMISTQSTEGQDMDKRATNARISIGFAVATIVFGLLIAVFAVVYFSTQGNDSEEEM